jgi:23S rRNA (adenine2503-C2)-methyltransferase
MESEPAPVRPTKRAVLSLTGEELERAVVDAGGKPFHARSIRRWILERGAERFDAMTDLPKAVAASLDAALAARETVESSRREAPDGTVKLLLRLADGETIEVVRMPGSSGATACISTQVGCPMACVFCASGLDGLVRNLRAHEIVEQVLHARSLGALTRIVVMGIGEPTLNLDALLAALDTITAADGIGLSARRITVSTVGLPDRIRKLAAVEKPYTLAISLHAPNDALRHRLIPTSSKVTLAQLLHAAKQYFDKSGREVTFEYVLLGGVNDRLDHARELAQRLRGVRATVNLIPYNPVEGLPYQRPLETNVRAFREALRRAGIVATVRWSKGLEADAACGQLRIHVGDPKKPVTR